jgi:hypothetical protein
VTTYSSTSIPTYPVCSHQNVGNNMLEYMGSHLTSQIAIMFIVNAMRASHLAISHVTSLSTAVQPHLMRAILLMLLSLPPWMLPPPPPQTSGDLHIEHGNKSKSKAIPLTARGGLQGYEMLRIPHCLDNRLTVNCEILATCSSTYSPVLTSQEAHSSP